MSQSPYPAPPQYGQQQAPLRPPTKQKMELVSQGTRFINWLVDRILLTVFSFAAGFVFGMIIAIVDPGSSLLESPSVDVIGFFIGLVVVFVYFVIFEATLKKSPAKFLTGTKVVNENGGDASFGQILGRTACRFIPFEAFSFLFGDSARVVGWHDKFSGTLVVKD